MYDFTGDSATIHTGGNDYTKSGLIDNYNRRPYLPQWPAAPCNNVAGASDGVKFPTMLTSNDTTMFFRKSLCRAIPMVCTMPIPQVFCCILNQWRYLAITVWNNCLL